MCVCGCIYIHTYIHSFTRLSATFGKVKVLAGNKGRR